MATVLYVTSEGSTWWTRSRRIGNWAPSAAPAPGSVWVVTDLPEETLLEISVPKVFGPDRTKFVARQLANRFPETLFRATLAPTRKGNLTNRLSPPQQVLTAIEPADRLAAALDLIQGPLAGVWSTSVLLTQVTQSQKFPATALLVLSQSKHTRIVFIRDRIPVLTRLVSTGDNAADQAVEIVRTLRHLENTRVIERGAARMPALLLGAPQGLAAVLSADRIDALALPAKWLSFGPLNWRFVLFDLACRNPEGQLAQESLRIDYRALQLRRSAKIAMAVCVLAAVVVSSGSVFSALQNRKNESDLNAAAETLTAHIAEADSRITAFGVAPEMLVKVLALDNDEIVNAVDLRAQLTALARAVASVSGSRVKSLQWQLLRSGQAACRDENVTETSPETDSGSTAVGGGTDSTAKVEVKLAISLTAEAGPRLRLKQATALTQSLRSQSGAVVVRDPSVQLRDGDLGSNGVNGFDTTKPLEWCLVMPGARANPDAEGQQEPSLTDPQKAKEATP